MRNSLWKCNNRVKYYCEASPHTLCNGSSGLAAQEDMTGEPVQSRVFGDEAEVSVVDGVESAERYVLQRVEIVMTRSVCTLQHIHFIVFVQLNY